MKTRHIIGIGLVLAAAVFLGVVAFVNATLPAQSYPGEGGKDYGYVYSGAKSASVDFTTSTMPSDSILLFGSSELSTPPSLVPQVPAAVFGQSACGLDLTYVGEAYDQCLWQAIAAGAYAGKTPSNKVVITVSPSWFADGGVDDSIFKTRFSYSLYREFMANDDLSETTKKYVRTRLAEQGIDEAVIVAGESRDETAQEDAVSLAVGTANDAVYAQMDDLRLRNDLQEVREKGFAHETGGSTEPNFTALRARAQVDAAQRSTNNSWGYDDASYLSYVGDSTSNISGKLADETFSDTPEYDDFGLFLRVCKESGLEPLVVISPLSGDYYDAAGVSASTRRACYDHIKTIANAYGVEVADFTDREYEKYFLHDPVHYGWTGWVDVEQAIYRFARED